MIRKPKISKLSKIKKRSNPSTFETSDLVNTVITSKGKGNYQIVVLVGGKKLSTIKGDFDNYDNAKIAADIAKQTVIEELKLFKPKRSNPDEYRLRGITKDALNKAIALPDDKMDVFELGVLYGTQNSLKNYCGAFDFLKRRKVIKAIDREMSNALAGLARKIEVRGEGIEGPIPIVKRVSSKS